MKRAGEGVGVVGPTSSPRHSTDRSCPTSQGQTENLHQGERGGGGGEASVGGFFITCRLGGETYFIFSISLAFCCQTNLTDLFDICIPDFFLARRFL